MQQFFNLCVPGKSIHSFIRLSERSLQKKRKLKDNWAEAYLFITCSLCTNKDHCSRGLDNTYLNITKSPFVLALLKSLRMSKVVRDYKLMDKKNTCLPQFTKKNTECIQQIQQDFFSPFCLQSLLCLCRLYINYLIR